MLLLPVRKFVLINWTRRRKIRLEHKPINAEMLTSRATQTILAVRNEIKRSRITPAKMNLNIGSESNPVKSDV